MNKKSLASKELVLHAFVIIFDLQNLNYTESFGIWYFEVLGLLRLTVLPLKPLTSSKIS